jgi:hypothetical protein
VSTDLGPLARKLAEIADETLTSEGDPEVYGAEMAELARRIECCLAFELRKAKKGRTR